MKALNSITLLPLAQGQRFRVNSFDLGFINIQPVNMVVEVKTVSYASNELELAPLPVADGAINETLVRVARWFREGYPTLSKDNCLLKNALAFERLVGAGVAMPEKALSMPLVPVSLLTSVQKRISWPSMSNFSLDGFHLSKA